MSVNGLEEKLDSIDTELNTKVSKEELQEALPDLINLDYSIPKYRVSVTISGSGTVNGTGLYEIDDQVTLEAIPSEGYKFVSWNTDTETLSEESIYTFTFEKPITIVANFEQLPQLETPNVSLQGSLLKIENIDNATGYDIYVDGDFVRNIERSEE